jgi:hypothetical protein
MRTSSTDILFKGLKQMSKKSKLALPKNAYIHIDMIHVVAPCRHKPIGKVKYDYDEDSGPVPSLSFGVNKALRSESKDTHYIRSKGLTDDGYAHLLELRLCPLKLLQRHNAFGHSNILDYIYHSLDRVTHNLGIEVSDHDRKQWKSGFVTLSEVHLTGNFACLAQYVELIIKAIDENNEEGKQKPLKTSISLGFHGKRRSRNCVATIYYKFLELEAAWRKRGPFKNLLLAALLNAIRGEIKLYDKGLKALDLTYGANWKDVDVAALFFSELNKFNIMHAIQPQLSAQQLETLTKAEQNVYLLWLHGTTVRDQFMSRSSAWKYTKSIKEKTGVDVGGNRKPDEQPLINIADIICPAKLLPIPQELFATAFYFPPGRLDLPPLRNERQSDDFDPDGDQIIVVDGQRMVI